MGNIPKKILEIEELVYILPDDFKGSISEALLHMLKYVEEVVNSEKSISPTADDSDPSIFKLIESDFENKASLKFMIHQYNEKTNSYESKKYIGDDS